MFEANQIASRFLLEALRFNLGPSLMMSKKLEFHEYALGKQFVFSKITVKNLFFCVSLNRNFLCLFLNHFKDSKSRRARHRASPESVKVFHSSGPEGFTDFPGADYRCKREAVAKGLSDCQDVGNGRRPVCLQIF